MSTTSQALWAQAESENKGAAPTAAPTPAPAMAPEASSAGLWAQAEKENSAAIQQPTQSPTQTSAGLWAQAEKENSATTTPAAAPSSAPSSTLWAQAAAENAAGPSISRAYGPSRTLSQAEVDYGKSDPEKMEEEPWYSKAWEWMNSPFYDLHKWGTHEGAGNFEKGLESGLEDLGNSFITPLQVGLLIATFGGSAVEGAGIGVLKSLGVGEKLAPTVVKTLKAAMSTGFAVDMAHGLVTQSPEFLDALKDGDVEAATRLGTNLLGGAALFAQGAHHGFEDIKAVHDAVSGKPQTVTDSLKIAADIAGKFKESTSKGLDLSRAKMEAIREELKDAGVEDKVAQAAIRHYITFGGDVDAINKALGVLEGTTKKNLRPEGQDSPWSRDHVFAAVESKYADMVKNAGIKSSRRETIKYYATADEALAKATTPDSGSRNDLTVFSVPRAEVEAGIHADLAAKAGHAPPAETDPIPDDKLITERTHMPGHELERNADGKLTGNSTPLRPLGAEDLPGDNSRFLKKYTPKEQKELLDGFRYALTLTDEEKAVAESLRQFYDESFNKMHKAGLIREWVEAYHPQAWADKINSFWQRLHGKGEEESNNSALNQLRDDADSGRFSTNVNQAKQRAYRTELQGLMAGEKFKHDDLALHAYNHYVAVEHAMAGREYLEAMRAKDLKAGDGRPAAVLAGTSRIMGSETGNPAVAVDPQQMKRINISNEIIKGMQEGGADPRTGMTKLEKALKDGIIERLPWDLTAEDGNKVHAYAWSTDGYVAPDHSAMRGWNYSGQDTNGAPVFLRGDLMIHPDFVPEVRRVLGIEESPFRSNKILRSIGKASGEAKGLLLSISPFHIIQEGLRAVMMGVNPFTFDHMNINESPTLQRLVKNGLKRDMFKPKDEYSTGYASHSKFISRVPGLNALQSKMQEFLFEKYIPSLKDRAALKLYEDIGERNTNLTADERASRAADMTNDVFGGQDWHKLGVSASQQDFMRMFALAPDWLVSEIRMLGRAAGMFDKETGAITRKKMVLTMAGLWGFARVANMLASGNMHNEAPFGVVSKNDKGEEKVYSVRTLPTDLLHVMTDPRGFLANRINPLTVRPTMEFLSGRDALGRRAPMETQASDLVRNIVPIAGQSFLKPAPDATNVDQILKASGLSVLKYRTEAEKLAQQLSSDRMPSGPVSERNLAAHQTDVRLETALQNGEISRGQVLQQVGKRRADEIFKRQHMTPLQARFDRLPLADKIDVWDVARPAEKDQLTAQLWRARVAYIKEHPPSVRANDPTWRKLQSIHADLR